MVKEIFSTRYAIAFLLFTSVACHAFFAHQEIRKSMTNAMESSLKNIYVNDLNQVCIDKTKAVDQLNYYLQMNLKLNADFSPKNTGSHILSNNFRIDSLEIFDPTTGLPVTIDGKQYAYPTIHLKASTEVKFMFGSFFGLQLGYPVTIDIIESNEPFM